jgi:hypothetical protein
MVAFTAIMVREKATIAGRWAVRPVGLALGALLLPQLASLEDHTMLIRCRLCALCFPFGSSTTLSRATRYDSDQPSTDPVSPPPIVVTSYQEIPTSPYSS